MTPHTAQGFLLILRWTCCYDGQCSLPATCSQSLLLACNLQQLTHTLMQSCHSCAFTPQNLTDSRGHSLSPRAAPPPVHMHRACPHSLLPAVTHIRTHTQGTFPPLSLQPFFPTHAGCLHDPCTPTCSLHSHPIPCSASHTAEHSHPFLRGACCMPAHMHAGINSQTAFAWLSMAIPPSPGASTDLDD